jgi:hypothetical protein
VRSSPGTRYRCRTEAESGCDGAEHRTVRLLHVGESRAETRCIAREELNGRTGLVPKRRAIPVDELGAVFLPRTWTLPLRSLISKIPSAARLLSLYPYPLAEIVDQHDSLPHRSPARATVYAPLS